MIRPPNSGHIHDHGSGRDPEPRGPATVTPRGLTTKSFDSMSCSAEGCTATHHLYIHPQCHPEEKTVECFYQEGSLYFRCGVCDAPVTKVAVQEET